MGVMKHRPGGRAPVPGSYELVTQHGQRLGRSSRFDLGDVFPPCHDWYGQELPVRYVLTDKAADLAA